MERDLFSLGLERLVDGVADAVTTPFESYNFDLVIDAAALRGNGPAQYWVGVDAPLPTPRLTVLARKEEFVPRLQGLFPHADVYTRDLYRRRMQIVPGRSRPVVTIAAPDALYLLADEAERSATMLGHLEGVSFGNTDFGQRFLASKSDMRVALGEDHPAANVVVTPDDLPKLISRLRIPPLERSLVRVRERSGPNVGPSFGL